MAQRSLIRAEQMDTEGAYQFAQLVIDGYSGGDTNDGYLMGLVLRDGYLNGTDSIRMDAHTGAIRQLKNGQVVFSGNVDANLGLDVSGGNLTVADDAIIQGNTTIEGDLTVNGTTTTVNTQQMIVTDPITTINASGLEIMSDWTGFTAHDVDGYNRIGWLFDGYWGVSVNATASSEAVPTRALAYIGAGDSYGDLSSTAAGNSGASKVGVNPTGGIVSNDVQSALEELSSEIIAASSQTDSNHYTLNADASAGTLETACYISKAGSGTALVDGYLCLVPSDSLGDSLQFKLYRSGVLEDTRVHVGSAGATENLDAYLQFNAGNGSSAVTGSFKLDGSANKLVYTANSHEFIGATSFNDLVNYLHRQPEYN